MKRLILRAIVLNFLLVGWSAGQTARTSPAPAMNLESVKGIDAYCREVDQYIAKHDAAKLTFGRDCSNRPEGEIQATGRWCTWKQFDSEAAWNKFVETKGNYGAAFVWLRDGKVAQVNFTFQTDSYDWANLANYCFRPDGSLAKLTSTLNDMNLNISVYRETLYSSSGTALRKTERSRDLTTKKPKRVPDELRLPQEGADPNSSFDAPLYGKVSELPFIGLIQK
jgi:hypothetical protein